MTPEETQAAREWTARKMGWEEVIPASCPELKYWGKSGIETCCCIIPQEDWQPDIDANQCLMLVYRMRELGWRLRVDDYGLYFCATWMMPDKENKTWAMQIAERRDNNYCHAIIKAAMATEDTK